MKLYKTISGFAVLIAIALIIVAYVLGLKHGFSQGSDSSLDAIWDRDIAAAIYSKSTLDELDKEKSHEAYKLQCKLLYVSVHNLLRLRDENLVSDKFNASAEKVLTDIAKYQYEHPHLQETLQDMKEDELLNTSRLLDEKYHKKSN